MSRRPRGSIWSSTWTTCRSRRRSAPGSATTARRESLRVLRVNARLPAEPSTSSDSIDPAPPAGAALMVAERDEALWAAFERLPERCRVLLRMLTSDPAPSYEEIGAILGMPIGSIGPTRIRCLAKLRTEAGTVGITAAGADS